MGAALECGYRRGILTNPAYTGQVYSGRTQSRPPLLRRSVTHPLGQSHDSYRPLPREEWVPVTTVSAVIGLEEYQRV